jgi:LysR family transcriptional regulator, glycine cleavage system transcriptional activator
MALPSSCARHDPKIICCARKLARTLKTPGDLAKVTLLHPVRSTALWSDVLAHLGDRRP